MAHSLIAEPERRWPAIVSVIAVGGLYAALPQSIAVGPRWLQLLVVCALEVPTVITLRRGHHHLNQILGHIISGVMTAFMIWSLVLLVLALPSHKETPATLLQSAVALWATNVLVFAGWYWRLDGGGPNGRDSRDRHDIGAFLFPQMTMGESSGEAASGKDKSERWSPVFIDYLFLSFNTSTAFSPTDAPVLSRWAKVLTMIQSSISLSIVILLAARFVNIL